MSREGTSAVLHSGALPEKIFHFAVIEDDLLAARHDHDRFEGRAVAAVDRRLGISAPSR
jgi:hypothetical protein